MHHWLKKWIIVFSLISVFVAADMKVYIVYATSIHLALITIYFLGLSEGMISVVILFVV